MRERKVLILPGEVYEGMTFDRSDSISENDVNKIER